MYRNNIILSTRFGDLDGDLKSEKVTLIGSVEKDSSAYINSLQLVIQKNNSNEIFNINMEGYQFNVYLVNILKGNSDQILITGQYGGTGGYCVFRLYKYKYNKLKLMLDNESLAKALNCSAKYLKDYKVEIECIENNQKYIIDISKNFKGYLDLAYNDDKNPIEGMSPTTSAPNTIYPIIVGDDNHYTLQIQQRIVGVSNSDLLGAIQSVIEVGENNKLSIKSQYLLLFKANKDIFLTQLPIGAEIISLDKFGGKNDIIITDLNNDYNNDIIFAYKYNGDAYLGIGLYENDIFKIIDIYKGRGLDISYLDIKPVDSSYSKTIIIGWKIREISSNLDLLVYSNNKLKSILVNNELYFGKIDVLDFNDDGIYEIVLWSHDTGEAYIVKIYKFENDKFVSANEYDKLYYPKVLNYYQNLVNKYPTSPTYLNYLNKAKSILDIDAKE